MVPCWTKPASWLPLLVNTTVPVAGDSDSVLSVAGKLPLAVSGMVTYSAGTVPLAGSAWASRWALMSIFWGPMVRRPAVSEMVAVGSVWYAP